MQRIELLYIECDFSRGYKFHSLLGSVGKRAETNFNFPAPPFKHISGIYKNLQLQPPPQPGRKREDPGNEVESSHVGLK